MMNETIGNQVRIFQAAQKSSRQRSLRMGVTVVRLESQWRPARICSKRWLGRTKSITVVAGSPVMSFRILYGALFAEGAWGLMRKPFGIGSNCFSFSRVLRRLRHHPALGSER